MTTELKSLNIEENIRLTRFFGGNERGLMVSVHMPRDKEVVGEASFSDAFINLFNSLKTKH